jgi:hypothetical protein
MLAIALALVAAIALTSQPSAQAGTQTNPEAEETVANLVAAVSAGDSDAVSALVADDLIFTEIDELSGSFAIYGEPAFISAISGLADVNTDISIRSMTSSGNQVSGVLESSGDDSAQAGVNRYLETFTITVDESTGLVTRLQFAYVTTDAETQQYLAYVDEQEEAEEFDLPPDAVTVALASTDDDSDDEAGEETDQDGEAFLFTVDDGVVGIGFFVANAPLNSTQPARIHSGTCEAPGAVVQQLAAGFNGESFTLATADLATLTGETILVVQESESNTTIVSCGSIPSAAAPSPAPVAPQPVAPAPAPAPGPIISPDTGYGPDAGTGDAGWTYALAALGAAAVAAGVVTRKRAR